MNQSLFDDFGRRIPQQGMRVYAQESRRYFRLNQPLVDYGRIHMNVCEYLSADVGNITYGHFMEVCEWILEGLRSATHLAGLAKAVRVPFLCPPRKLGQSQGEELLELCEQAGKCFQATFPDRVFMNLCKEQFAGETSIAPGSRYEKFEEGRAHRWVVGLCFPNCLSEFDLDSQRAQMASLPEIVVCEGGQAQIVLSGGVDLAAALVSCPDLLSDSETYPHHLCLSALEFDGDNTVCAFEAYGKDLRLRPRSNMLTPTVTQVSEQWAGGLTVFTTL